MDKLQISQYKISLKKRLLKFRRARFFNITLGLIFVILLLWGITAHPQLRDYSYRLSIHTVKIFEYPLHCFSTINQFFTNQKKNKSAADQIKYLQIKNYLLENKLDEIRHENARLKQINHYISSDLKDFINVEVIGSKLTSNHQFLFANSGSNQGVKIAQAVLNEGFIVGTIDEVTLNTCRIRLISNHISRTPAYVGDQSNQAIIYGRDNNLLRLQFQNDHPHFNLNDIVYSSGLGGIYPAHKIIGRIAMTHNQTILIKPIVNFDHITTVQIILTSDHEELSQLLTESHRNHDIYH